MIPGLAAAVLVPEIGTSASGLQYNDAIPYLMQELLPNGVLGIAVTGLLAAFMAGMAANVSSFNTVFTTDIWARYVVKDREDGYYVRFGRLITAIGVLASIGTAFLASSFSNIMSYLQTLFSFFNVPMFVVFIIGMFWKRASMRSGFWGLLAGTVAAMVNYFVLYKNGIVDIPSDQGANFVSAIAGFVAGAVVMVAVSLFTKPKPEQELQGLVYGTRSPGAAEPPAPGDEAWYRRPALLGWGAVVLAAVCYIPFSI
jgi:SSS family solute:Na+ symporter